MAPAPTMVQIKKGGETMERQEPKLGKDTDLRELEFRPRRYSGPEQKTKDDGMEGWLKAGIFVAVLIATAMGLIEWNARRQAAAMANEMLRPMTPSEEATFKAQISKFNKEATTWSRDMEKEMEIESADELERARRILWNEKIQPAVYRPRPLAPGERCMQGRRLQRIENGWQQLRDPC
ncbi:hypothetical protein [Xanthomonas albilineans]|uniref:hypothetical protein n=1 Tax=Xanthomonas albilineans TaxID=29447 RepID=UPI001E34F1B1|nr:hypothetical protein [Xanthomonas albilineans]